MAVWPLAVEARVKHKLIQLLTSCTSYINLQEALEYWVRMLPAYEASLNLFFSDLKIISVRIFGKGTCPNDRTMASSLLRVLVTIALKQNQNRSYTGIASIELNTVFERLFKWLRNLASKFRDSLKSRTSGNFEVGALITLDSLSPSPLHIGSNIQLKIFIILLNSCLPYFCNFFLWLITGFPVLIFYSCFLVLVTWCPITYPRKIIRLPNTCNLVLDNLFLLHLYHQFLDRLHPVHIMLQYWLVIKLMTGNSHVKLY